ncbi:hypothetical protein ACET3X_002138 [Alternaria dauci]|uniref:Uncharacterized protein n=1 Tax=Alternaria dauci TaxID=48095 RepID=A0ABR3UNQ2_9PLEO
MDGISGKVVIVTGASSGIGLSTTLTLHQHGAKVLACDVSEAPDSILNLEDTEFVRADLTQKGVPEQIVKKAMDKFGKIDGLLNIAGVMDTNNSVDSLTDETWERTIAINLTAPVNLMRAVVPHMLAAGGGSIVNVSSKAGISGSIAGVAYTSSKHGIIGATKNVAFRFREDRIRCNATCSGGVKTNITKSIDETKYDTAAMKFMKLVHDLYFGGPGIAEPQSHANVLAFLISDLSSEINGAIIPVDQGWSTI